MNVYSKVYCTSYNTRYNRYQPKNLPIGVAVHHRVVAAVGVAVEALRREGALHLRVGAEEAAQYRVVEAGVHVDDAKLVVVLVACESAMEAETATVGDVHPPVLLGDISRPVASVVADFAPRRGNAPFCRPYAAHRMGLAGVVAEIIVLYAVNRHLHEASQGIVGVALVLRCVLVAARGDIPFVVVAVGERGVLVADGVCVNTRFFPNIAGLNFGEYYSPVLILYM